MAEALATTLEANTGPGKRGRHQPAFCNQRFPDASVMSRYRNSRNLIYRVWGLRLLAEEHTNPRVPWAGQVILRSSAQGAEEAGHSLQGCAESRLPTLPGHFLPSKASKDN